MREGRMRSSPGSGAALLATLLVALLLLPAGAAARAADPPGLLLAAVPEGEHGGGWAELVQRLINLGLLLALLWWLVVEPPAFVQQTFDFPGLRVYLRERADGILQNRQRARSQLQQAEEVLGSSEARLDRLEAEVEELLREARSDAERERARAEEEGKAQAEKVMEMAQRELRAEALSARRSLRAFVADLVVEMAEDLIRRHLGPADEERLVEEYLSRLGERVA